MYAEVRPPRAGATSLDRVGRRLLAEILGDEAEREQAPGEVDVAREEQHRLAHAGQLARTQGELVDRAPELRAPVIRVELDREPLDRDVVDRRLALGVAARGLDGDRTALRPVQLRVVDLDVPARDVREHRQRVAELAR